MLTFCAVLDLHKVPAFLVIGRLKIKLSELQCDLVSWLRVKKPRTVLIVLIWKRVPWKHQSTSLKNFQDCSTSLKYMNKKKVNKQGIVGHLFSLEKTSNRKIKYYLNTKYIMRHELLRSGETTSFVGVNESTEGLYSITT